MGGGTHSEAAINPRALTMDLKDIELMVQDHEARVSTLESSPAPSSKKSSS